jgi:hypothetical protein
MPYAPALKHSCQAPLRHPLIRLVTQFAFVGLLLCLGVPNATAWARVSIPAVLPAGQVVHTKTTTRSCWRQCAGALAEAESGEQCARRANANANLKLAAKVKRRRLPG